MLPGEVSLYPGTGQPQGAGCQSLQGQQGPEMPKHQDSANKRHGYYMTLPRKGLLSLAQGSLAGQDLGLAGALLDSCVSTVEGD